MTWSLLTLALLACDSKPTPPSPDPQPSIAVTAPAHPSMADHMAKMEQTRDGLRKALGEAYDQPVSGLDAANPASGKATYDLTCAPCHGATGKGDGASGASLDTPPADFTDSFHARYYSDAGRIHIIEHGADGTPMPAFGSQFDHAQVLDLYAYVRTFREPAAPPSP